MHACLPRPSTRCAGDLASPSHGEVRGRIEAPADGRDVLREDAATSADDAGPACHPLSRKTLVVLLGVEVPVRALAAGRREEAVGVGPHPHALWHEGPEQG
eukprot:CAMPEP_0204532482 /NCGR_PEP_ID=MMETSP0661-20131031/11750_1 /ASSEMBLY_ACC=CAM_ASM_000606 /TAXON_ID=109239 /ORGANISM="Alexandrium margalefi, Strain AMGDE01CS-322" /LENGTH=100 /DNA_ID=CAMNT_0051538729 /DNA_START=843 /DNA_END=1142 /DNA_ORIENTATION=-